MLQENIIDDEGLERDDDTGEYIDEPAAAAWKAWKLANDKAARASQHPDDVAVDRFALAMKAKLADARDKGRTGWDDPAKCSVEYLAQLLVDHIGKDNAGNFEDVANLAMMLHQRGADPSVLAEAAREKPADEPVAWRYISRGKSALFNDSICRKRWKPGLLEDIRQHCDVEEIPLYAAPPAPAGTRIVEQIAQQWDECEYDGIDIGAAIRAAGVRLTAEAKGGEA
ncbi:hypothetical protein JOS77_28060 [Chromobacterium haemolyticum]|nr:hypothetical protein JOS77_28060 [Chromobacterium haemolyticum]